MTIDGDMLLERNMFDIVHRYNHKDHIVNFGTDVPYYRIIHDEHLKRIHKIYKF